jgi:carbon monoxide dehydrogenase subunit G
MELNHQFSVPTGVEETWAHFEDIASVADCFPGATVTSVEGSTFEGTCKVKLGPIALLYTGSGTFTERDETAHRFVVEAKGKDKRGNGTAGATVSLGMVPGVSGGTDVAVHTDLAITGKPAQFGRGVMQDVSDKLLGQFVACLEHRLGADVASGGEVTSETAAAAGSIPPTTAAAPEPVAEPAAGDDAGPEAEPVAARHGPTPPPMAAAPPRQDALDLGATVLPILVKTYWKQALVALVVIAVVVWLLVG